ncbi:MAG: ABC transporter permease [Methanobrevibacter thaueri]|nr:ABC transporter permease [Methanobrevibacter thaueri]
MNLINENGRFLLEEIVKKNFSSKYKGSVLGILWSVLKPLLIMIILTIIFSALFTGRVENYPVYLLSGRCIYDFFSAATNVTMMAIKGNQNILKRTPAPKFIFILGGVISEFLNFIISLIILFGVMLVTGSTFYLTIPLAIIPIISVFLFITGIGFILSIVCVYYTDIQHLWGVITMMVMYGCAIFYPMDIIPEPFHSVMILNPMFWIIDQFRDFVVYGAIPDLLNIVNSLLISVIVLLLGIIIFKKYEKKVTMKF